MRQLALLPQPLDQRLGALPPFLMTCAHLGNLTLARLALFLGVLAPVDGAYVDSYCGLTGGTFGFGGLFWLAANLLLCLTLPNRDGRI
jgi:hypothetical protein